MNLYQCCPRYYVGGTITGCAQVFYCYLGRRPDGWWESERIELESLDDTIAKDLLRVGLISASQGESEEEQAGIEPELRLFLPLLRRFDVRLVPFERRDRGPVAFCTGLLKPLRGTPGAAMPEDLVLPAGGQGMCLKNAAISCLGEIAERVSLFRTDIRDVRISTQQENQSEVGLGGFLGYSPRQERAIFGSMSTKAEAPTAAGDAWNSLSDKRVRIANLATQDVAWLPEFGVLFGGQSDGAGALPRVASTIGCAVWRDRDGARERALLELAERDAIAQGWYNRLGITPLSDRFLSELLPVALDNFRKEAPVRRIVCRVDTDLPVHVVCAVSHDGEGFRAAFGSAARWTLADACESALLELFQSENSLDLMEKAYPAETRTGPGTVPRRLDYARNQSILDDLPLEEGGMVDEEFRDICNTTFSYRQLLRWFVARRYDIWEFDATRSDLNIPCVKLLSSDLCSWEPRFGKARLYNGVVERGLRDAPADEAEFAARPFPF